MTHSGFKTAQKIVNLSKKENNNKDYRSKEKIHSHYTFSRNYIGLDYILRTKHRIYLNEKNINFIRYNYAVEKHKNPHLFTFEEYTEEENKIIQQEIQNYYNKGIMQHMYSCDKTHTPHSKILTKNRNKDRKLKLFLNQIC